MESKARVRQIARDVFTNKTLLTLEIDNTTGLERIAERDLRLILTEWHERRSISANNYFHLLCGKIADALGVTSTEVKNGIISDYGQPEVIDGSIMTMTMRDAIEWRRLEMLHLKPTASTRVMDDGRLYRVFIVMRPTHTYDTAEMSRLIDGAVSAAHELVINTMTPDQIARMKALWRGE